MVANAIVRCNEMIRFDCLSPTFLTQRIETLFQYVLLLAFATVHWPGGILDVVVGTVDRHRSVLQSKHVQVIKGVVDARDAHRCSKPVVKCVLSLKCQSDLY